MTEDPSYNAASQQLHKLTNEELGALLREYLGETEHNNWDGWAPRDATGARAFVRDMALYQANM